MHSGGQSKDKDGATAAKTPTASVLSQVKRLEPSLRPAERRVADFLLENANQVIYMPITEVSAKTETSDSTVIRLCRRMGFGGFQDLKIALARELVAPTQNLHGDILPEDDLKTAVNKAFAATIQAVRDTQATLDFKVFEDVIKRLVEARRIVIYGIGTSGIAALDAHYKFLRIGISADVYTDGHLQAISASQVQSNDLVMAFSHSGSTKDIVAAVQLAKDRGATIVVITNFPQSPVGNLADLVLRTQAEETPFGSGGIPSITAQLALIDALFVGVAMSQYDEALESLDQTADAVKSKKY